jgi:hypothetical protein
MPLTPDPSSGPPYPGEPAVLHRLPREVEFTFIKMILDEIPDALTTALWVDNQGADDLSTRFRNKTYGATDRALRDAEAVQPKAADAGSMKVGRSGLFGMRGSSRYLAIPGTPAEAGREVAGDDLDRP